jgi:hypothetical protein
LTSVDFDFDFDFESQEPGEEVVDLVCPTFCTSWIVSVAQRLKGFASASVPTPSLSCAEQF